MSIRIVDMPDLGAVTDDSSVVGEHAGSGRFAMTAMRTYITTTGGGPFLPLTGGSLSGSLYIADTLHVGSAGWTFVDQPSGRLQQYVTGFYDVFLAATGVRQWVNANTVEMTLSPTGELWTANSVTAPTLHATGNANVDGTLTAQAISAPGGIYTAATITAVGNISSSGSIGASGNVIANLNVQGANVQAVASVGAAEVHIGPPSSDFHLIIDGSDDRCIYWQNTWKLSFIATNGNLAYTRNDGVTLMNVIGYNGDFGIVGNNAFKPGGGSWASPSDSRIKTVTGDYTRGLAEIKALSPKRFIYRGNDTVAPPDAAQAAPYITSPHYMAATGNTEFAGLVAQDLEAVMPEMVTRSGGYIDGTAANDIMTVDRSSLDLALVNAIKELEARIAALEAVGMAAQRTPAAD